MTDYTDDLFALRLALQDTIFDETRIIRELKMFLIERNVPNESINQTILDFYKKYNIDFTEEFIASVSVPAIFQIPINNNGQVNPFQLLSQLQNISNQLNSQNNNSNNDASNTETNDGVENEDVENEETNEDVENEESNEDVENEESNNDQDSDFDSDEDWEEEEVDNLGPLMMPFPPNLPPHPQMNQAMGQLFGLNPSNVSFSSPQAQLINTLNQLLSVSNMAPPPMEDVKATLDDSDMDTLEVKTAEEDLDFTCSISMTKIKKGDKYVTLPCDHTFQESCIRTWLKEYNYKCPVCRKECGKPKYNI